MMVQQKHVPLFSPLILLLRAVAAAVVLIVHPPYRPILKSGKLRLAILAKIDLHIIMFAPSQHRFRPIAPPLPSAIVLLLHRAPCPLVVITKREHVHERNVVIHWHDVESGGHVDLLRAEVARVATLSYQGVELRFVHVPDGLAFLFVVDIARAFEVDLARFSERRASRFGTAVYHHHRTAWPTMRRSCRRWQYRFAVEWRQRGYGRRVRKEVVVLRRSIPKFGDIAPGRHCGLVRRIPEEIYRERLLGRYSFGRFSLLDSAMR
mmetsp:Transcript_39041/g.93976  ORF Transcript_39041/g.93976 Transcript_39041/m.93976 type:complete len:264 (-) Transcript_39041:66-857(-)